MRAVTPSEAAVSDTECMCIDINIIADNIADSNTKGRKTQNGSQRYKPYGAMGLCSMS